MRKLYFSFLTVLVMLLTVASHVSAQAPVIINESEPNNTFGTAQVLNLGAQNTTIVAGAVSASGDNDWFRIDGVPAGAKFWGYVDGGGTLIAGSRDSELRIFEADGTTQIEFDDDDGTGNGGDGTEETGFSSSIAGRTLTTGGTYFIRINGFLGTAIVNPYKLFINVTPAGMGASEVEPNGTAAQANSIVTAVQTVDIRTGSISSSGELDYYSVVAVAGQIIYVSMDGDPSRTGVNTLDGVVSVIAPDGTTILINTDSGFGGANNSEGFSWNVLVTGTYYIRVRGFGTESGRNYSLMVSAAQTLFVCTPPVITIQPVNPNAVCAGSNTTFTVSATGSLLTYQWQENSGSGFNNITNGGVYSGATTQTLTITGTPLALTGYQYRVVITGACGVATSSSATLTLNQTVHTSTLATPVTMCSPGATVITGTASGSSGSNVVLGSSGNINLVVPDNTPAGVNSTIALPAGTLPTAADLKIRVNIGHASVGDLKITLTSPCGTTLLFDRPGVPATASGNADNLGTNNSATPPPAVYIFDIAAATIIPEASVAAGFIPAGTYKPSDASNPGFAHNWAGITFPCGAGNWTLNVSDNSASAAGSLVEWAILKTNNYTHTLTGPGTIVQNPPTGSNNANASFNVTAIPAGNQTYVLTSTDAAGCAVVSNVSVTVNATPVVTIAPPAPVICSGQIQQLTATVTPPIPQLVTGGGAITINDNSIANPYPSTLVVTGLPVSGVTVKSVSINGMNHTFPGDIDIVLQSPSGANVILMSDAGAGTDLNNVNLTFDDAAATVLPAAIVSGTFRPTNTAGPDNFPAPGPGSITQVAPTLLSFGAGDYNGIWRLFVVDDAGTDFGTIGNWNITFNIPVPVVWTTTTGALFSNAGATIPYTGTPTLDPVYVKPTATTVATTTTYTATATRLGCTGSANVTVTANALPAISTEPTPATQTICPGFNVTYTVAATGTGLTYQWRKNGVNLTNGVQASGSLVSGATTTSVTLMGVVAADAGTYTVVVSGACTPPATPATSIGVVLVIGTAPTITTQPVSRTVCEGLPASFTVATGGTPAPTIYQWQVFPPGGPWTDLTTGGSYTTTFTIPAVTLAQSGNLYRVIVTNSCGQSVTSNGLAALTVTPKPVVTAAQSQLPARICLSGPAIPLVGSPAGGTWSGIGVSGSNFVPSATAVGTYTLTYTFTNVAGCTSTATILAKVVSDGVDCNQIRLLRDDAVILYPNPNDGLFNIRINSTLYSYLGMHVYSSSGQRVRSQIFNNLVYGQVVPIDLTKLPAGPYMVKFYYDGGVRTADKTFTVIIGSK